MTMKRFLILTLSTFLLSSVYSQELKCRVTVTPKTQQESDKDYYNNLRKAIEQFMNGMAWTDHVFDEKEKIEVNIAITVKSKTGNALDASLQIQSNRPIFNSRYSSTMLNIVDDKFQFTFQEFETIEFQEQNFNSNLTYVLAYYTYVILGLDYDSFSLNGGNRWFQKAEAIVNNAQTQTEYVGWKAFEDRQNRYWLIENILNSAYSGYRNAMYFYYRSGLDIMSDKPIDGRAKIMDALNELESVHKEQPGLYFTTIFFQTKYKELIDIFSEASPDDKTRVMAQLKKMDPGHASDYDKITVQK